MQSSIHGCVPPESVADSVVNNRLSVGVWDPPAPWRACQTIRSYYFLRVLFYYSRNRDYELETTT